MLAIETELSAARLTPLQQRDPAMTYNKMPLADAQARELAGNGRRADGSLFPLELSLSPLLIGDSPLVAAALRDVSARKAVEDELERYRGQLEAQVTQRTAQLAAAKEAAEAASVQALLDAKSAEEPAAGASRFVVQVGAFAEATRSNIHRDQVFFFAAFFLSSSCTEGKHPIGTALACYAEIWGDRTTSLLTSLTTPTRFARIRPRSCFRSFPAAASSSKGAVRRAAG